MENNNADKQWMCLLPHNKEKRAEKSSLLCSFATGYKTFKRLEMFVLLDNTTQEVCLNEQSCWAESHLTDFNDCSVIRVLMKIFYRFFTEAESLQNEPEYYCFHQWQMLVWYQNAKHIVDECKHTNIANISNCLSMLPPVTTQPRHLIDSCQCSWWELTEGVSHGTRGPPVSSERDGARGGWK